MAKNKIIVSLSIASFMFVGFSGNIAMAQTVTGSGTLNYVPLWTSTSTIGDSVMYQNNSKIGIGTTTPSNPLDISSANTGGTTLQLANTSAGGGKWQIVSTGSGNSSGANDFGIYGVTLGNFAMLIQSDGNVGIGTASPTNGKLEVNGGNIYVGNGNNFLPLIQPGRDITAGNVGYSFLGDTDTGLTHPNINNTLAFAVAGVQVVTINSIGNIGIGTTTPATALSAVGIITANSLSDGFRIVNPSYDATNVSYTGYLVGKDNTGTNVWYVGDGGSTKDTGLYNSNAQYGMGLYVGGAYRLYIASSTGNVGIGITAPTSILHTSGTNAPPATTGSSANSGIRIGGTGTNLVLDAGINTSGAIYSWIQSRNATTYDTNYALALNPNGGNVGIGTTVPGAKLEVEGNVKINGSINRGPTNIPLFRWLPIKVIATYTGTGAGPFGIAFDGTNMWTANASANSVTKILVITQ